MTRPAPRPSLAAAGVVLLSLLLASCASTPTWLGGTPPPPPPPPAPASLPPAFGPDAIVGRWGFASYHKESDRARTEAAARGFCKQPYVIGAGATGGVIMHLADQSQPLELRLKGGPGGKTYIGPDGEPGGMQDREVVSFDGKVLVLRWIDPEVAGRYGTGVYVRCGPRA